MRFASPGFLSLLLLLPLVLMVPLRRESGSTLVYSSLALLKRIGGASRRRHAGWLGALRVAALACVVLGLARPQLPGATDPLEASGVDIVLAIDASGSMRGQDFFLGERRVTRLEAVQSVVRQFVLARRNDRLALVVFGKEAFTQCPLTLNYDVLLDLLDALTVGIAGDSTAIGNALARGVQRLRDSSAASKVVVLLSDGVSNAGNVSIEDAIAVARAFDVRVYTIGIGTGEPTEIAFEDDLGLRRVIKQEVQLDEASLETIAEATGGRFFKAADTEDLAGIYAEIDGLERAPDRIEDEIIRSWRELFPWSLLAGAALLLIEAALARTRFRKVP